MPSHAFRAISGLSLDDCAFLADRWNNVGGWSRDAAESWIGEVKGGRLRMLRGQLGWLTSFWRSPSGLLFASDATGAKLALWVGKITAQGVVNWYETRTPFVPAGIWGLDDDFVLAWGGVGGAHQTQHLWRWEGASWRPMATPDGTVVRIHGASRDLVYAVGQLGMIARLDGGTWQTIPSPTQTMLSSVFVAGEQEIYACGTRGRVLEGTIYGWSELLIAEAALSSVVKWHSDVLVGSATLGLSRLDGNVLVPVDPDLRPHQMDARGNLLLACEDRLAETTDGKAFRSLPIDAFKAEVKPTRPLWRK
jgi:hypothetical protein